MPVQTRVSGSRLRLYKLCPTICAEAPTRDLQQCLQAELLELRLVRRIDEGLQLLEVLLLVVQLGSVFVNRVFGFRFLGCCISIAVRCLDFSLSLDAFGLVGFALLPSQGKTPLIELNEIGLARQDLPAPTCCASALVRHPSQDNLLHLFSHSYSCAELMFGHVLDRGRLDYFGPRPDHSNTVV